MILCANIQKVIFILLVLYAVYFTSLALLYIKLVTSGSFSANKSSHALFIFTIFSFVLTSLSWFGRGSEGGNKRSKSNQLAFEFLAINGYTIICTISLGFLYAPKKLEDNIESK